MIDYIGKLNIVAAEYLAKAGMARVACVTCAVPQISGSSTGAIFLSRPLSVRVAPTGSACNPGPNGVVYSKNNPYDGASGQYVSVVNVPYSTGCDFATCVTILGGAGDVQRYFSYAANSVKPCGFTSPTSAPIPSLRGGPTVSPTGI